jgi:hypothetical protein
VVKALDLCILFCLNFDMRQHIALIAAWEGSREQRAEQRRAEQSSMHVQQSRAEQRGRKERRYGA